MTENKRKRFTMSNLKDVGISDHEKRRLYDLRTVDGVISVYECLNELHEENQQIKNNIKEAYKNERTSIGKSVLKQLLNSLEINNE